MATTDFGNLITQVNNTLTNFSEKVAQDMTPNRVTGTVTFTKKEQWVGSPSSPLSSITVSSTGGLDGATAAVYYSGAVLTDESISGGTVVMFQGTNVLDELCIVFIIYDKLNNCYHVNIMGGATGETPTPPTVSFTAPVITVSDPGGISFTAPIITVTDPTVSFTAPTITVTDV